MKNEETESGTFEISLDEDGIVNVDISAGTEVTLKTMKEINLQIKRMSAGKKMPVLTDFGKIKSVTREARMFPSSEDAVGITKAVALLVGSPVSRMIGNFHLGLNKPPYPVKLFSSRQQALEWLKGFADKEGGQDRDDD